MPERSHSISVRDLVEFVLRTGDLGTDRDFFGPTRALEGTRGHQRLQASRPTGYESEVPLSFSIEAAGFVLKISGRVDGILSTPEGVLIEEIKTVRNCASVEADPLHWAQGKLYAFMYAMREGLRRIDVQLTYLDLDSDTATPFRQTFTLELLEDFFRATTHVYLAWLEEQFAWKQVRDGSIEALAFPFPQLRAGQSAFMAAATEALSNGRSLFAEAPTGIGKTIAALYPAVKSLNHGTNSKIFFLSAKTVGKAIAESAFEDLRRAGLRLRTLTLTAREKLCFNDGQPCDMRTCPFAMGYYDRARNAVRSALEKETLTRSVIEAVAQSHRVCPSALAADVSLWTDAIICDYNYVFDPKAYLRIFFDQARGDYAFLIDEAHNLVDRARDMFSADLDEQEFKEVKNSAKDELPRLAKRIAQVAKVIGSTEDDSENAGGTPIRFPFAKRAAPAELIPALKTFLADAEVWLAQNKPARFRDSLLSLYFRATDFLRTLDQYDERYFTLVEKIRGSVRIRLFCLDPATLIQAAVKRGRSAIFFSATLTPMEYFQNIFGHAEGDAALRLPSPFPVENLRLLVAAHIPTDYKRRASSVDDVVRSISAVVQGKQGNYLVYFPSYQYLNAVLAAFRESNPTMQIQSQSPGMPEEARDAFLRAFRSDQDQTHVGFAVMGGVFGEGIDLRGDRLTGAIIVGVGLPQLCLERDLIRARFDAKSVSGFDYAYVYPGMIRVLQAVGRVIRSETERGVVLLIDTRFAERRYRELFPEWWEPRFIKSSADISQAIGEFWDRRPCLV